MGQKGHIDLIFRQAKSKNDRDIKSTPLAVIEFGLTGIDLCQKFDQGVKYVDRMREPLESSIVLFDKPFSRQEQDQLPKTTRR